MTLEIHGEGITSDGRHYPLEDCTSCGYPDTPCPTPKGTEVDKMKVIVAGSRTVTDIAIVRLAIEESGFKPSEIVSGCARGVDTLAIQWADRHRIPVKRFPADWQSYGRRAGPLRNIRMAEYADALVAVWDGQSRGTMNMIHEAYKRNLEVYIHYTEVDKDE